MVSEETGKNQMRPLPGLRTENTAEGEAFYVVDDKSKMEVSPPLKCVVSDYNYSWELPGRSWGFQERNMDTTNPWWGGEAIKLLMSPAFIDRQLIRETLHPKGRVCENAGQDGEVEGAIWNS